MQSGKEQNWARSLWQNRMNCHDCLINSHFSNITLNMLLAFLRSDVDLLIGRASARFYQMVCICKQNFSACNTQLDCFSSFGSLERRWCVWEKEEKGEQERVKGLVHRPDGFKQTPSKAKDEMSHLGAILLGGIWLGLGLDTWHQPLDSSRRGEKIM